MCTAKICRCHLRSSTPLQNMCNFLACRVLLALCRCLLTCSPCSRSPIGSGTSSGARTRLCYRAIYSQAQKSEVRSSVSRDKPAEVSYGLRNRWSSRFSFTGRTWPQCALLSCTPRSLLLNATHEKSWGCPRMRGLKPTAEPHG